jgi:hypothetical protein
MKKINEELCYKYRTYYDQIVCKIKIQQTQETNITTEFKSFIVSYFQEQLKIIVHTCTHAHTHTIFIPAVLKVKSYLPKSEE